MDATVWNNLINAIVAVILAWIAYKTKENAKNTVVLTEHVAAVANQADAQSAKLDVVVDKTSAVTGQLAALTKNTDGIKDALVAATERAALLQGEKNERQHPESPVPAILVDGNAAKKVYEAGVDKVTDAIGKLKQKPTV